MKVAIHQPQYLPWLGFFDKMDQSDIFVLLDDVQYKKNEWQNRNKIRNAEGWQWLTVPVLYDFGQKINEVKIDNRRDWREKHMKSLELNYSKAPYFKDYSSFFREVFEKEWEHLAELSIYFISGLKDLLGIETKIIKSSRLNITTEKTDRLVDLCKKLEADVYLSGAGGSDYLDESAFAQSGIKLEYQKYTHPEYDQVYKGFYPHMSVADLLFCCGDKGLDIIREGRK
jgi:hypothetical protein